MIQLLIRLLVVIIFQYTQISNHHDTCCCCSVTKSWPTLWPHELQHTRLPCPSLSPRVCSNSSPLSQWCIQQSHPLSSPSLPAFNLFKHHGLFQWVSSSHQVAKYWSFSFSISPSNEYSGLISFSTDSFISLVSKRLSRVFSNNTVQKHQFFGAEPSYGPTLTSVHDYWKKHSFDYTDQFVLNQEKCIQKSI